jgi:hypothetical protein
MNCPDGSNSFGSQVLDIETRQKYSMREKVQRKQAQFNMAFPNKEGIIFSTRRMNHITMSEKILYSGEIA